MKTTGALGARVTGHKEKFSWRRFREQGMLQAIVLVGLIYIFIFNYIPMVGLVNAFNNFKLSRGLLGFFTSPWVGFKWFKELFSDPGVWLIIRNTIVINGLKLIFSFPFPIILALVINEINQKWFKKIVQTVSYLPYFISWIVVSGILFSLYDPHEGVVNQLRTMMGLGAVHYLTDTGAFWPLMVISDVWKNMGWGSIIFLAAISGIDQSLYEAAIVDGAGRFKRILHITLPGIRGTIIVLLILNIASLFSGSFDQCYMLGNNVNYSVSQILPVYSLQMGLAQGRFSYATAIGLLQSLISLVLIFASNSLAKKFSGSGLF